MNVFPPVDFQRTSPIESGKFKTVPFSFDDAFLEMILDLSAAEAAVEVNFFSACLKALSPANKAA